ncbi:hypothetical protein BpHYR1_040508 [Brachionus plicatilis]|uniref:Uncharacterized protein n=1 Tax=Brachionus plicatilis TaxID=10195 RepID=A0A3M7T151_BRAPC|nr:hypothetical protein BpHYR1_040508 [Brachionus plicatilis]
MNLLMRYFKLHAAVNVISHVFLSVVATVYQYLTILKSKDRIRSLSNQNGDLIVEKETIANLLGDQFQKTFSIDTNAELPSFQSGSPDVTVLCRAYSGSVMEFYNMFYLSFLIFWPHKTWKNSDMVIVLDSENELDHRMGSVLAHLYPYPKVFFEKMPQKATFCSNWRNIGYSRTQYSNFYSDLYTDKEYIAIVDSDSYFVAQVTPEDLFVDGKPRIIGYNGCCTRWLNSIKEALGVDPLGEFMNRGNFPIIIKRNHFKQIRMHITKTMATRTFEEAFHSICSKYKGQYSQFDLLVHYLWYFKRNEYSWHLKDVLEFGHYRMPKRATNDTDVIQMNNKPMISVAKHAGSLLNYPNYMFKIMFDYMCVASDNQAGSCGSLFGKELFNQTLKNLFVDYPHQTTNWTKRGMLASLHRSKITERPWASKKDNLSYLDYYNKHLRNVRSRNTHDSEWKWINFNKDTSICTSSSCK